MKCRAMVTLGSAPLPGAAADAEEAAASRASVAVRGLTPLEVAGLVTAKGEAAGRGGGGGGGGGAALRSGVAPVGRLPAVALSGRAPPPVDARPDGEPSENVPSKSPPPAPDEAAAAVPGRAEPGPRDIGREPYAKDVDADDVDAPSGRGAVGVTEKSTGVPASERGTAALPPSKLVRQIMTMSSPPAVAK